MKLLQFMCGKINQDCCQLVDWLKTLGFGVVVR